jgi:AcrR family transcriptional regulator
MDQNTLTTRKEREKQNRRCDIIKAARIVFARRGFNEATLDEIADVAEYGKGTLYNYFQSKEELFDAVIDDGLGAIVRAAHDACDDPNRPLDEAYLAFARKILQILFENAELVPLIMRELHRYKLKSQVERHLPEMFDALIAPLIRARKAGKISAKLPPAKLAILFFSMVISIFKTVGLNSSTIVPAINRPPVVKNQKAMNREIDQNLHVLRQTFFTGILATASE